MNKTKQIEGLIERLKDLPVEEMKKSLLEKGWFAFDVVHMEDDTVSPEGTPQCNFVISQGRITITD